MLGLYGAPKLMFGDAKVYGQMEGEYVNAEGVKLECTCYLMDDYGRRVIFVFKEKVKSTHYWNSDGYNHTIVDYCRYQYQTSISVITPGTIHCTEDVITKYKYIVIFLTDGFIGKINNERFSKTV